MEETSSGIAEQSDIETSGEWSGFYVPEATEAALGLGLCANDGVVRKEAQEAFDRDVERIIASRCLSNNNAVIV